VADRARGFEMKIAAYDPFLDAAAAPQARRRASLARDLLAGCGRESPSTRRSPKESRNLLNRERIASMKKGASRRGAAGAVALRLVLPAVMLITGLASVAVCANRAFARRRTISSTGVCDGV